MPGMNGTGPAGQGPMTGRGIGPCGEAAGIHRANGRGWGIGPGRGSGYGGGAGCGFGRGVGRSWCAGPRRGLGWFAAGYATDDVPTAVGGIRSALENRAAMLRAELARTESMLTDTPTNPSAEAL
jgi:hypothetical protein